MTNSTPVAPLAVQGAQQPSHQWVPPFVSSTGEEALELVELAGMDLDPWQKTVLVGSLGERADGSWSAFEVGLVCPRQNGKNEILAARQLVGLFILGERLIVHSAHQFDTSLEAFRRLLTLLEENDHFESRIKRVSRSHGEEGVELLSGQRIRFRTRTKGGGRGFTSDCLMLDEAMEIAQTAHGALLPTLSARPNPQVWYAGSPVDQWIHEHGVVLSRIRQRGRAGDDPRLAYFEWSAADDNPDEAAELMADRAAWARANPGLGIRISEEHVENEMRSMDPRTFAVERLGIGDWPRTDGATKQVLDLLKWEAEADVDSRAEDPLALAFDVSPDRSIATIGISGVRSDGRRHVEVIDRRRGTSWVVDRLVQLDASHSPTEILCDGGGPAASLLAQCEAAGLEVKTTSAKEYAQACGTFYDAVDDDGLRHLDTAELNAAIKGAAQRALGDAWAWSRKSSSVDITPLVAVTLALWGSTEAPSVYEDRGLLTV